MKPKDPAKLTSKDWREGYEQARWDEALIGNPNGLRGIAKANLQRVPAQNSSLRQLLTRGRLKKEQVSFYQVAAMIEGKVVVTTFGIGSRPVKQDESDDALEAVQGNLLMPREMLAQQLVEAYRTEYGSLPQVLEVH